MFSSLNRQPVRPKVERGRNKFQGYTFPAPTRGWILNENMSAAQPGGALTLDNWFPTTTGIRARAGSAKYATIGAGTAVQSMFTYRSGGIQKFFASNATAVYQITTPASPTVSPAAEFSGQTSGYYTPVPFTNVSGS